MYAQSKAKRVDIISNKHLTEITKVAYISK